MFKHVQDFIALDRLKDLGELHIQPMFGGLYLSKDGHYFGLAIDGRLYFRTTAETAEKYEKAGMKPLVTLHGYDFRHTYEVPPEIAADSEKLCSWAREAIEAAS